ncbi:MAG: hypothetical protein WDN24_15355 [Sphingomonas sp.]
MVSVMAWVVWLNGSDSALADTRDDYGYAWRDQAMLSSHVHDSDTGSGGNPLWTTGYAYDGPRPPRLGPHRRRPPQDGQLHLLSLVQNPYLGRFRP